MTSIPIIQSETQINIPGIGLRNEKCLADGYVFHCKEPSNAPIPKLTHCYNHITFKQETGIETIPRPSLRSLPEVIPHLELPPPLRRPSVLS